MSDSTTIWTPNRPASAYSEEEIREVPDFKTLRSIMPDVGDETVLELARRTIEARWVNIRDGRRNELVEDFVEKLRVCDPELEKVSRIEISLSEDGISMDFKRERAPRWDEDSYAKHLGTFEKEYTSTKHPEASGTYKLEIQAGRNENETVFMRLTEPSGKVLQFPAENEDAPRGRNDKGERVADADLVECSSISRLLRDSTHATTLSVWQYFGLNRSNENNNS